MKTLQIPALGAELTLGVDWTFELYAEHRNVGLVNHFNPPYPRRKNRDGDDIGIDWYGNVHAPVTLPAGTVLTVRRYYIRLGQSDFDSVTFSAKIGKKSQRFWAKLADVNRIVLASAGDEWASAQSVCDHPDVGESIRNLLADQTGDNATCMVRDVIRAAGIAKPQLTQAQIDHIGEQWDGCMYDAVGMTIDIGASIRAELLKLVEVTNG